MAANLTRWHARIGKAELGVQRKRRLTIRSSRNRFVVPKLPWSALGGFGLTHGVRPRRKETVNLKTFIVLLVLAALAWFVYGEYQTAHSAAPPSPAIVQSTGHALELADDSEDADSSLKCDGRTMCSQMTSCAEATYFIQHCPNTKMDGNNDGVPCERQWCN